MPRSPESKPIKKSAEASSWEEDLQRDIVLNEEEIVLLTEEVKTISDKVRGKIMESVDRWRSKGLEDDEDADEKFKVKLQVALQLAASGGKLEKEENKYEVERHFSNDKKFEPFFGIDISGNDYFGIPSKIAQVLDLPRNGRGDISCVARFALKRLIKSDVRVKQVVDAIFQGIAVNKGEETSKRMKEYFFSA